MSSEKKSVDPTSIELEPAHVAPSPPANLDPNLARLVEVLARAAYVRNRDEQKTDSPAAVQVND